MGEPRDTPEVGCLLYYLVMTAAFLFLAKAHQQNGYLIFAAGAFLSGLILLVEHDR